MIVLEPAYEIERRVQITDLHLRRPGNAAVLLLDALECTVETEALELALRGVWQALPSACIVLRLASGQNDQIELVRWAARAGMPCVTNGGVGLLSRLRQALTQPDDLEAGVPLLLQRLGMPHSAKLDFVLRALLRCGDTPASSRALLREAGISDSTARALLRKKRLPRPHEWVRLARALHAALALQAEPGRAVLSVALEHGFHDDATLHRLFVRCFGLRPREVKGTLGWGWLVERWWRAHS